MPMSEVVKLLGGRFDGERKYVSEEPLPPQLAMPTSETREAVYRLLPQRQPGGWAIYQFDSEWPSSADQRDSA